MYKQILSLLALFVLACSNPNEYSKAEDAQEAGTQFIRASLDGNYAKARFFLLKDSTNLLLMKQHEMNYEQLSNDTKRNNREASIRPIEIKKESDSVTLYKYYHTSNTNDTTTIRIIREKGEWLVDLKSILKM
jgi:type VI protein secretion system component Hcp